jgi:hypothetical protein
MIPLALWGARGPGRHWGAGAVFLPIGYFSGVRGATCGHPDSNLENLSC